MGGRKSLAALPIGQTACDVLIGCESRGDRRKYTAVLLAVADYYLFGREPGRCSGVDNDLWSALKGEADRIRGEKKAKSSAGKTGGRPNSAENVSIGKHPEASESIGKHEEAEEPISEASGADKKRREENRIEDSPLPPSGNPISFQDEEDAFGDLWEVYPRKTGWNEARRAFHRAVAEEGVAPATILNAVMEQSRSEEWREKGGKYVPSLARWLDGARWNDRLSSPGEKNDAAPPAQGAPRYMTPQDLKEEWARQAAAEQSTAVGESGGETETEPKPNDNRKETDP